MTSEQALEQAGQVNAGGGGVKTIRVRNLVGRNSSGESDLIKMEKER